MKEQAVEEILIKHHVPFLPNRTIWATILPSVGAYQNGFGNLMHTMKDHILHITPHGIAILAVDDHTGKLCEDTLVLIPRDQILATSIHVKLTKFILTIECKKGCIQYKVRKNILACPWHKENLSFLLFHEVNQEDSE